jgi:hypothetical protein
MTKKSERTRPSSENDLHPGTVAWEEFRAVRESLFTGSPERCLEERLKLAFEEGWNAATRAFLTALARKRPGDPAHGST